MIVDYRIEKNSSRQTIVLFSRDGSSGIELVINESQRCIDVRGWARHIPLGYGRYVWPLSAQQYGNFVGIEGGRIMLDDLVALFKGESNG